jgi:hypothetical protein
MTEQGMYWWNANPGTDSKDAPLMALDSKGLRIKGEIHATSGTIGPMTIEAVTSPSSG